MIQIDSHIGTRIPFSAFCSAGQTVVQRGRREAARTAGLTDALSHLRQGDEAEFGQLSRRVSGKSGLYARVIYI